MAGISPGRGGDAMALFQTLRGKWTTLLSGCTLAALFLCVQDQPSVPQKQKMEER